MVIKWAHKWYFPHLFRGQTTDLEHEIEVAEKLLAHVREAEQKECKHWLEHARGCLSGLRYGYSKYDEAWSALHEIRHIYCRELPAAELERIAEEIASDLVYMSDERRRKACEAEIEAEQKALHAYVLAGENEHKKLHALHANLGRLSLVGANVRQTQWHRVNLLRARLMITAVVLTALTVALLFLLLKQPDWLGISTAEASDKYFGRALGVVGFGALGGLLSALRQQEPLVGTSSIFYIERTMLGLRPIVGAVAALMLYFAQLSGWLTIGVDKTSSANYFFVAFCAGFSEQFFLRHLSTILEREKKKKPAQGKEDATGD